VINVSVTLNDARLEQLLQLAPDRADQLSSAAGRDLLAYLHTHWSTSVPSVPGAAPAVRSGILDRSITLTALGNGLYQVSVGASYAPYLEGGTRRMGARPFWRPALYIAERAFRKRFVTFLELLDQGAKP
jgi:hypothetical protein